MIVTNTVREMVSISIKKGRGYMSILYMLKHCMDNKWITREEFGELMKEVIVGDIEGSIALF